MQPPNKGRYALRPKEESLKEYENDENSATFQEQTEQLLADKAGTQTIDSEKVSVIWHVSTATVPVYFAALLTTPNDARKLQGCAIENLEASTIEISAPQCWISAATFLSSEGNVNSDTAVLFVANDSDDSINLTELRLWLSKYAATWQPMARIGREIRMLEPFMLQGDAYDFEEFSKANGTPDAIYIATIDDSVRTGIIERRQKTLDQEAANSIDINAVKAIGK